MSEPSRRCNTEGWIQGETRGVRAAGVRVRPRQRGGTGRLDRELGRGSGSVGGYELAEPAEAEMPFDDASEAVDAEESEPTVLEPEPALQAIETPVTSVTATPVTCGWLSPAAWSDWQRRSMPSCVTNDSARLETSGARLIVAHRASRARRGRGSTRHAGAVADRWNVADARRTVRPRARIHPGSSGRTRS